MIEKSVISDKTQKGMNANRGRKRFHISKDSLGLYLLFLPSLIYVIVFLYGPMYGVLIAFKDFSASQGIWNSPWATPLFRHFTRFFDSYRFVTLIKNTLTLSVYTLAVGFPIPIILALVLNQTNNKAYKKVTQFVSYIPYFISTVVLVGMLSVFLSPQSGIVNIITKMLGGQPIFYMGEARLFKHVYVWSNVWQTMGWSSIIYIASLSGVNPELHESAVIDGASKIRRIISIDLPLILPTVMTMLVLNSGRIMSVGFEKAFLMQNNLNIEASEIISTYVYKVGLLDAQFSFSAAVGLFNSVINCVLVLAVNYLSKKLTNNSLW